MHKTIVPQSKPLVAHFRSSEFFGGPEQGIASQLLRNSHFCWLLITFLGDKRTQEFSNTIAAAGQSTLQISASLWRLPVTLLRLRRELSVRGVVLLVTHDYKSNLVGLLLHFFFGIKWLPHFHGFTSENLRIRLYNVVDTCVLRLADRILCVSEATKCRLERHRIAPERVHVIPNSISPGRVKPLADLDTSRFDHADPFRFIAVGRLSPEKGFDQLILAFDAFRRSTKGASLDIFGDGPMVQDLEELIVALALQDSVILRGHMSNVIDSIRMAHCLVVPSTSEGMPNVILEAWGQGTPVIATSVGGIPEMITNEFNGLLVSSKRPDLLANAMISLAAEPELAKEIAHNGRLTIDSRFDQARQFKMFGEIYMQAIA